MPSERLVIVMASIFGDESADEKAKRVFAVAGLVGTDEQWDSLVDKWVVCTEGREFHAAEWETEYANDPDPEKHKKNCRIYAQLSQLIAGSGLRGWGVAIDLGAYKKCFPHIDREIAYHKCLMETTDHLVMTASELGMSDLKFTFDHRQGELNTGILYDSMTNDESWRQTGIFFDHEISFTSRKNPRIQVADLMARETMKHLDNMIGPKQRPTRKSFEALATTKGRLKFEFLMREYFEDMKRKIPEAQKAHGMRPDEYQQWLKRNKVQDNINSRHRFLIWFEAEHLKRKSLQDTKSTGEFENFDRTMRDLMSVPHDEIKAALDAEKAEKQKKKRKAKKPSASGRAGSDGG